MASSTTTTILQPISTMLSTSTPSSILETITPSVTPSAPIGISFCWYDYVIFCSLLSTSLGIGIYFGFCGKKQDVKDYLLAGGNMKVLPVVISLIASHTSGVTLLALPSEVYAFGPNYGLSVFGLWIVSFITVYVFLPVFYKLQLTSTYEYLGIRFDKRTRKLASVLFALSVAFSVPIITYIPALAFSSATGLNVYLITPVICGVCIFYTAIGGLKALVWSDTLQLSLTIGSLITILGLGISNVGGVGNIFTKSYENERLDLFDFSIDLTKRDAFWTIVIGFTMHWIAVMSIHQGSMQKFLAVGTFKESKIVVFFYCGVGMVAVKLLSISIGLTLYTKYADCDPLLSGKIRKYNEILPYFVLDVASKVPGLSGLFIAGIFCASLSALSGNMNSLAGTIYEDFVKSKLSPKQQKNPRLYLKSLVVIVGVIGTSLVYVVEHLGGLLSLSVGLGGISQGPLLGLFTLGMIFPRAKAKGAFYGALVGMVTVMILFSGAYYMRTSGMILPEYKPVSIEGCSDPVTFTGRQMLNSTSSEPPHIPTALKIFKISFYWYALVGCTICITLGLLISYFSKEEDVPVARELLSPAIYRFIDEQKYINRMDLDYDMINMDPEGNKERRMSKWEENRMERIRKQSYISDTVEC